MAIREDEIAAGAMGVNHVHYKLLAFAIGAASAALTGTFYVAKLQTATPGHVHVPGVGDDPGHGRARRPGQRSAGVVLGALILRFLQSVILQDLTEWLHALGRLVGQRLPAAGRADHRPSS